jgi:hypothetical protein
VLVCGHFASTATGIRTRQKASNHGLFARSFRGFNRWATAQDRLESGVDCGTTVAHGGPCSANEFPWSRCHGP